MARGPTLSMNLMARFQRQRRRKLRAAGKCTECGEPAEAGKKKCKGCLAYQRGWYHANYGRPRQPRQPRQV